MSRKPAARGANDRPCGTCSHPRVADIHADKVAGIPLRTIKDRYRTGAISSLSVHFANQTGQHRTNAELGVADLPAPSRIVPVSIPAIALETPGDVAATLRTLIGHTLTILQQAVSKDDSRLSLQAVREATASLTTLGKSMGMFAEGMTVNVAIDQRQQQLESRFLAMSDEQLERFIAAAEKQPEALTAALEGEVLETPPPSKVSQPPADDGGGPHSPSQSAPRTDGVR